METLEREYWWCGVAGSRGLYTVGGVACRREGALHFLCSACSLSALNCTTYKNSQCHSGLSHPSVSDFPQAGYT